MNFKVFFCSWRKLFALLVLLHIVDLVSTYFLLGTGFAVEANPIARKFLPIPLGLVLLKFAGLFVVWNICLFAEKKKKMKTAPAATLALGNIFSGGVVLNNLYWVAMYLVFF